MNRSDSIKLYLDEQIWSGLPVALSRLGFDAVHACTLGHVGWDDSAQLAYAASQRRAILTFDIADFELLAAEWFFAGREHAGILLSDQIPIGELLHRLERILNRLSAEDLRNSVRYLQSFKA